MRGIRVSFDKEHEGTAGSLCGFPLHDPLIPVNVESDEKGGAKKDHTDAVFLPQGVAALISPIEAYLK